MPEANKPSDGAKDPGKTAEGATVVKASKTGGAVTDNAAKEAAALVAAAEADAVTEAEMRAAAEADAKSPSGTITPEEQESAAALSPEEQAAFKQFMAGRPKLAPGQKCIVLAEYTAGDTKSGTHDPKSALMQKWCEKGIRVFVKATYLDGTVIGMRTMAAEQARTLMERALSGAVVKL